MNEAMRQPPCWDPGLTGVLPHPGSDEDFWALARAFVTGLAPDTEVPDTAGRGGANRPRVWLLTHRLGGEETGALGGLVLSGLMARRGHRVLLVDADEAEMILTRRSRRLFKSGWVDMMRYGSSLDAAAVTVDWEGMRGYFLGLGSYCPPEITAAEVAAWLPQLAGDVDDVVVVVGAAAAGPWQVSGARVLFTWDRRRDPSSVLDRALADLATRDAPCDLVMACGPAPEPQKVPVAGPETPGKEPAAAEPAPDPSSPAGGESVPGATVPVRKHSSGIFRALALTGLVLVVIVAVAIWKATDLGRLAAPGLDESPLPQTSGGLPVSQPVTGTDTALADTAFTIEPLGGVPADSSQTLGQSETFDQPDAAPDSLSDTNPDSLTTGSTAVPAEAAVSVPEPEDGDAMDPAERWRRFAPAFGKTVGQDGWCLHVSSLHDSTAALREIRMIEARNVWAVGAPVVRRDSTRWFRIYVGSFPSRAAADSALPALKWKLKTDWAAPAVLPASAWD